MFRRIVGKRLIGTFTDKDFVTSQLLQIVKPHDTINAKVLLGIRNSTLMAYYYIAETNVAYLVRGPRQKYAIQALRVVMLAVIAYGALRTAKLAWALGDLGVGIMAWLNIVAIIWLRKPALDSLKDYEAQRKKGGEPTFDPVRLKIKGADFWAKKYHR